MFEHKPSSPLIRNPKLNYVPSGSTRRLVTRKLHCDERGADLCPKQNPHVPLQESTRCVQLDEREHPLHRAIISGITRPCVSLLLLCSQTRLRTFLAYSACFFLATARKRFLTSASSCASAAASAPARGDLAVLPGVPGCDGAPPATRAALSSITYTDHMVRP